MARGTDEKGGELVAEIGDTLRRARLKKGYSLEEVQQITKIQQRHLVNIEENNFAALPGDFYVRSFIEQYAVAVDIDPQPLLMALRSGNEVRKPQRTTTNKAPSRTSRRDQSPKKNSLLPVIILAFVAILIVGGVVAMTIRDRTENPIIARPPAVIVNSEAESSTVESTTIESSVAETTESSTVTSTTESSAEVVPEFVLNSTTTTEITMTLSHVKSPANIEFTGLSTGACWVGIIVNGDYTYQHTLQPGEVVTSALPENATSARVVLGAAGNAAIKINGQALDFNPTGLGGVKRNLDLTISYE